MPAQFIPSPYWGPVPGRPGIYPKSYWDLSKSLLETGPIQAFQIRLLVSFVDSRYPACPRFYRDRDWAQVSRE